jgi:virulence factor Mce-like protein
MTIPTLKRTTRAGRRSEQATITRSLVRGVLTIGVLGAVLWLCITVFSGVPLVNYRYVHATVPQIGDLQAHDPVRIAGITVGQVSELNVTAQGEALLTLQLKPGTKVPPGTTVALRTNGLLGARYVQVIPGTGRGELSPHATIHAGTNALTYGVPQALDTFDTPTRTALGDMINALGIGLSGKGEPLNQAIATDAGAAPQFETFADTLLAEPEQIERLLPALDGATTALAGPRADYGPLFRTAAVAVRPLVDQRPAVQQSLEVAPGALAAATSGLHRGETLLNAADKLAVSLRSTLPDARSGLRAASLLLHDSHAPLRSALSLLRSAQPAVPAALTVTGHLLPVLEPLDTTLTRSRTVFNGLAPYGCDFETMSATWRSMDGNVQNPAGGPEDSPGFGAPLRTPDEFRLTISPDPFQLAFGHTSPFFSRQGYQPPCSAPAGSFLG